MYCLCVQVILKCVGFFNSTEMLFVFNADEDSKHCLSLCQENSTFLSVNIFITLSQYLRNTEGQAILFVLIFSITWISHLSVELWMMY